MSDTIKGNANSGSAATPRRAGWLKTLHLWHWISSALCLLGMLLFSITGITLNHATQIEAQPVVVRQYAVVSPSILQALRTTSQQSEALLPSEFADWLQRTWRIQASVEGGAEWAAEELYLPLPRPGGDAWVRVDLESGDAEYEVTDRGWISYLNDLHKGRNSGLAWSWFIDLFAVLCLLFSITGLLILKFHAVSRPMTWPVVGLGVLMPVLLVLIFVH